MNINNKTFNHMKGIILLTIAFICFAQLLTAQQNQKEPTSSALKMLTGHPWVKNHKEMGDIQIVFKEDLKYTVKRLASNDSIWGTFSLKGSLLTFETDASCATKAQYTISVAKETLTFIKKEDDCLGRNEITPGTWKASK